VSDVLLRAEGLVVTYASARGNIRALDNLTTTLGEGEFLSIVGPSGCGKSTLLKIVAGLIRPSGGRVELAGDEIRGPRADVGIVFQQPTLLPWQSVLDNVLLPIRTLGLNYAKGRERAEDLLKLVGLSDFARFYPRELSGGMQQRVGIARCLVHDPNLLLMDEPFAALDAMTREYMMEELQRIWQATRKSVIFITHSIPEAIFLSDRVLVLSHRPGHVIHELDVDIPRPRNLKVMGTALFAQYGDELRSLFATPAGMQR